MKRVFKSATALKIAAITCKILGVIASFTAIYFFKLDRALYIVAPDFIRWFQDESTAETVAYILTFLLFAFGIFLFWLGQQWKALAAGWTIKDSSPPTLLYLRLFKADPSLDKQIFGQLISLILPGARFGYLVTPEEQLAQALKPVGDLIALGRPGELLPRPGAAALYASEAEWKEAVINHMRTARLVILRAGSSTSLLWEMEQAAMIVPPVHLLILFLRMTRRQYKEFCAEANNIFGILHGISLPDLHVFHTLRLSGFITFSKDWKPTFRPLQAPYLRRGTYSSYRRMFKFALRPVFEELGVRWQKPRISIVALASLALLALIAFQILQYLGSK